MAGDELKIQILRKSMSTFGAWLDSCDKLLASIPSELQHCNSPGLRELALKYKVCGSLPPSFSPPSFPPSLPPSLLLLSLPSFLLPPPLLLTYRKILTFGSMSMNIYRL